MDGLDKDRQVAQMQLKMERQTDDIDRKKLEFEQARANFEKERKALVEKLEGTKKKLNDTQDEAMRQKLDFGREQALAKQQVRPTIIGLTDDRLSSRTRRLRNFRNRWMTPKSSSMRK